MEKLPTIVTFLSVSIAPIASLIISVLSYINDRKKKELDKKVQREVTQKNTTGDNYYYEDNRKIEISDTTYNLFAEQDRLSIKQQNIDDIGNFFSKHSFWFVAILYVINVWNLLTPLPDYPVFSLDLNQETLLKFVANSLYRGVLPTVVSILLLLSLLCVALALKYIFIAKKIRNFISVLYYFSVAYIYKECRDTITKISIERIDVSADKIQKFELSGFIEFFLPFILILLLILLWAIAQMLIRILFETEQSKPNYRLLKIVFPRLGLLVFIPGFPVLIIWASQYI